MSLDFFLPYQKRWIADQSKTAMWVKSRRIGATYAESFRAVMRRLEHKYDYNFVSANLKTSIEFIQYCKIWCEIINQAADGEYIDLVNCTTSTIDFPNGSKIIALSSNPTALRGRSGDITLDEISFHDQPEEMFKAAQPVCLWGGTMRLVSSVSTPDSWFSVTKDRLDAGELPWSLHNTNILDAVREGLATKVPGDHHKYLPNIELCGQEFLTNLEKEVGNDAAWQQEYLCQTTSHSMLIQPDAYDKLALEPLVTTLDPNKRYGDLFVGIDIGRIKDLTVIWVLERGYDKEAPVHLRDVYRTICVHSIKGMSFEAQYQVMDSIISNKNVGKCCIDRSGLGMQLAEQLWQTHGNLVEPVVITSHEKQNLVERVLKFISQQRVSLVKDEDIKSDIVCLRRIVTQKGNISYDGRSNIGHGDHFIALAMALRAADKSSEMSMR